MSEAKFTPGPWEVVHTDDNLCMSMTVITPKGLFEDKQTYGMLSNEPSGKLGKIIAVTFHQLEPIVGFEACEKDEDDGNAYLIAAAPEMYEALLKVEGLLNELRNNHGIYGWSGEKAILDAISKAQGGET